MHTSAWDNRLRMLAVLVIGGLGLVAATACQSTSFARQGPGYAAFEQVGADATITVLPVVMMDRTNRDVADVVGGMLEGAGMDGIYTTDAAFKPDADVAVDALPGALGAWIKDNPPTTDYALFAELVGTRKTGVQEIRVVVVDKDGAFVWADRQTPECAIYKRVKPSNPMTCCLVVGECVASVLDLPHKIGTPSKDGRMARRWAEKSGTPPRAEYEAIEARQKTFKKAAAKSQLDVYPVLLGDKVDRDGGTHLVELIDVAGLLDATAATESPCFDIKPNSNEQRRLWDLAKAFRDHVRKHPPEAEYTLYAEYIISGGERAQAHTVHFIICDRAGEWVIVDFQNNHHKDFNAVKPKSRADCDELVLRRLKAYLR